MEALHDRLVMFMKRAGLKNPDVARATKTDATTVSKWRSGVQAPNDEKLGAIVELLRERGIHTTVHELRNGKPVNTGRVSEGQFGYGEVAFDTLTAKQRARVWLEGFLLELAEGGADQNFMDSSRRLLLNPANYTHGFGAPAGARDEMEDDQKLRHMQALAVGIREALKNRKRGPRK